MAAIRKNDFDKMSEKEMKAKIIEFERAILELEGEGKKDKARPLRKAIASMKTRMHSAQTLNTPTEEKVTERKPAGEPVKKVDEQK
ncbi:MAG TPA: hypothetical protein EYP90_05470 [Chromatiaceae bacterium]|nr:hypothetical protein [Chromatiaceae bacterium]